MEVAGALTGGDWSTTGTATRGKAGDGGDGSTAMRGRCGDGSMVGRERATRGRVDGGDAAAAWGGGKRHRGGVERGDWNEWLATRGGSWIRIGRRFF